MSVFSIILDDNITSLCWEMTLKLKQNRLNAGLVAGGVSRLRQGQDRQDNLLSDGWVGNLGAYTATRFITGSDWHYKEQQKSSDINPGKGDGGCDIPFEDWQIDIKTSLWRHKHLSLKDHNLLVRPQERHKSTIYVFCMVEWAWIDGRILGEPIEKGAKVWLVGWTYENNLPDKPLQNGVLRGAYAMPAKNLFPLHSLQKIYQEKIF